MILMPLLLAVQAAPVTPPAPPKVDCADADHRALDFWVGDWNVFATGTETWVANSKIEKIVGCAISETFDQTIGPGGKPLEYHGRSISSYAGADKGWRQFYVDSGGTAVTLTGGSVNGAMVLLSKNGPVINRMTVKPNSDGSVSQRGEFSTDEGKTWQPAYDFTYKKAAEPIAGVVTLITKHSYTGYPTRRAPAKRKRK